MKVRVGPEALGVPTGDHSYIVGYLYSNSPLSFSTITQIPMFEGKPSILIGCVNFLQAIEAYIKIAVRNLGNGNARCYRSLTNRALIVITP